MMAQVDQREGIEEAMRSLVAYCREGFAGGQPTPFAAEIVKTDTMRSLVRARNSVIREKDPTAHAEIQAIRQATRRLNSVSLEGYSLISTITPCAMCMAAVLWSRLDQVIFGTTIEDPAKGGVALFKNYSPQSMEASCGLNCKVVGPIEEELTRDLVNDPAVFKFLLESHKKGIWF